MQTKVRQFVPSEYGCDVEHAEQMLVPARSNLGISYTIISGNWIQGFLLPWAGETLKQIKRPSGNQSNHPIGEGNNAKEDQNQNRVHMQLLIFAESSFPLNFQLAVVHRILCGHETKDA
jgi:hypothetical protein